MSEQPQAPQATTAFMVVIEKDGNITIHTEQFPPYVIDRTATLVDIQAYCTQAAQEVTRVRLQSAVRDLLTPATDPPSTAVKKAIKRRTVGT